MPSRLNISNALTLLRILLAPAFVFLVIYGMSFAALMVFIAAGITDLLDGFLARRFKLKTELGARLDPVSDQILFVSAFIVLAIKGWVPLFLLVLAILRDITVMAGYLSIKRKNRGFRFAPSVYGKVSTVFQAITVISATMLAGVPFLPFTVLTYLTAAFIIYSGLDYSLKWILPR